MCDPREADYAWWTCTQEEELEQRQVRRKTIFLGANDNPEELAVSKGTSEKAMVATGVVRNPQKEASEAKVASEPKVACGASFIKRTNVAK